MSQVMVSEKQRRLFEALANDEELIFACGKQGVSANLVGKFSIRKNHRQEDQLDVDDGRHHVHVDWTRVQRAELGDFHGEGLIRFFCGDEEVFRFYRPGGVFRDDFKGLVDALV